MRRAAVALVVLYLAAYLAIRTTRAEAWEADGETYVIFPEKPLVVYYAFRPLSWLDAHLTGMRFHIGPHR